MKQRILRKLRGLHAARALQLLGHDENGVTLWLKRGREPRVYPWWRAANIAGFTGPSRRKRPWEELKRTQRNRRQVYLMRRWRAQRIARLNPMIG